MLRVIKPKTKRAKRALDKRAPKVHENQKKLMLLHGSKTSAVVKDVLTDLHALKRPENNSVKLTHKNSSILPFEAGGETALEFLSQKTDCSVFAFGSHSKKRPHNLVIGRMFDHHVYDMVELGIERHVSITKLGGGGKYAPQVGSKPCLAFIGGEFESRPELALVKSILLDTFRGAEVDCLNLAGLDRAFVVVAVDDKIFLRHCAIRLKKSGTTIPAIQLIPAGPMIDFCLRRWRHAGDELQKEAMKSGASLLKKRTKEKNVSTDILDGKVGRIYVPKQEVATMALAKMKGAKREKRERREGKEKNAKGEQTTLEGHKSSSVPSSQEKRQRIDS